MYAAKWVLKRYDELMRPYRRAQIKFVTTAEQAEEIARVARERGITKMTLLRDAVASATGAPNEFRRHRPVEGATPNGFDGYNARRKAEAAARRERERQVAAGGDGPRA